jgi:hypothetical protein
MNQTMQIDDSNWVQLDWLDYSLAIRQPQVDSIELAMGLREPLPHEVAAAWLDHKSMPIPVFCLDDRMRPCSTRSDKGYLLLSKHKQQPFGLWGDKVTILTPQTLPRPVPMPEIFTRQKSPVEGMAVAQSGRMVLLTSAPRLGAWLLAHRRRGDSP